MAVYFIRAGRKGPIKIGRAKNPWRRLHQMRVGTHEELVLLAVQDGDQDTEADLHRRFSHLHLRGEWFWPKDDLQSYLATLPPIGPDKRKRVGRREPLPPALRHKVPADQAEVLWKNTTDYPTVKEALAHMVGWNQVSAWQRFGPRERSGPITSEQAKLLGARGIAARRAKAKEARLPEWQAKAIWLDTVNYPLSRDALKAMKWPSYVTAWRAFGPRE